MKSSTNNNSTVRLSGAWTRSGKYGEFFVSPIKLSDLNEALATLGNPDTVELVVSPVREKASDKSPDFNINLRLKTAAQAEQPAQVKPIASKSRRF